MRTGPRAGGPRLCRRLSRHLRRFLPVPRTEPFRCDSTVPSRIPFRSRTRTSSPGRPSRFRSGWCRLLRCERADAIDNSSPPLRARARYSRSDSTKTTHHLILSMTCGILETQPLQNSVVGLESDQNGLDPELASLLDAWPPLSPADWSSWPSSTWSATKLCKSLRPRTDGVFAS